MTSTIVDYAIPPAAPAVVEQPPKPRRGRHRADPTLLDRIIGRSQDRLRQDGGE